jgi:hypothetical protein
MDHQFNYMSHRDRYGLWQLLKFPKVRWSNQDERVK